MFHNCYLIEILYSNMSKNNENNSIYSFVFLAFFMKNNNSYKELANTTRKKTESYKDSSSDSANI